MRRRRRRRHGEATFFPLATSSLDNWRFASAQAIRNGGKAKMTNFCLIDLLLLKAVESKLKYAPKKHSTSGYS